MPIQIWKLSVRMGVCLTTRVAQCDDICVFFSCSHFKPNMTQEEYTGDEARNQKRSMVSIFKAKS